MTVESQSETTRTAPAIACRELTKYYRSIAAVDSLNLTVPTGSITALLGPNGAGKTTTLSMLLGLVPPTSGQASLLGRDSSSLGPADFRRIAYVAEGRNLPLDLTVSGLIAYCQPLYPNWDFSYADELLRQFKLPLDRRLKDLSRGFQMKVQLLVALAFHPELLIMDEPFSGLDPMVRDELIEGILAMTEQREWTVLISSHDLAEVGRLADRIAFLWEGRLVTEATTPEIEARYRRIEALVPEEEARAVHRPEFQNNRPPGWLQVEASGRRVIVVDSQFEETATRQAFHEFFPGAENYVIQSLTLADTYRALAKEQEEKSHRAN